MATTFPTTPALTGGDPAADGQRRAALRRMRAVATGLLVLAAIVYLATLDRDGALGFVNAAAEASMVGAIADWFAVTALFRHPLGIPIPHTALIPRRKDDLGRGLEEFVGENFLQEAIIRDRIGAAEIARRFGDWLSAAGQRAAGGGRGGRGGGHRAVEGPRRAHREPGPRRADAAVPGGADLAAARAGCCPRRCATTCTTGWSTSRSRSCTAGWSRTRTRSPR